MWGGPEPDHVLWDLRPISSAHLPTGPEGKYHYPITEVGKLRLRKAR